MPLSEEDRENLVAYLDGELDEEATQAMEARLSQDPAARAELDSLKQVYGLLDYLPRPEPSGSFTHRTMERVALVHRPRETGKMPAAGRRRLKVAAAWVAVLLVMTGLGWFAGSLWKKSEGDTGSPPLTKGDPDELLLRHLRLFEHYSLYESIGDFTFLVALDQPALLGDDAAPEAVVRPMPAAPAPEPSEDDLAQNRRKLTELEKQPERLAQLRRQAQLFRAQPAERQDQLLKLAHQVCRLPRDLQARLVEVMQHYHDWLETLDAKDRQQLVDTTEPTARLGIVKELRDREWLARQPQRIREEYAKLEEKARSDYLRQLQSQERKAKIEWVIASRFWSELQKGAPMPARLSDFPTDVQTYVNEYLRYFLSNDEWDRLLAAQGEWPRFPIQLVKYADKHPPALPGPAGHRRFEELPTQVQKMFKAKVIPKMLKGAEGRWPDFARALTNLAETRSLPAFPYELWPWSYKQLSREMQDFYDKKLWPILSAEEKRRMTDTVPSKWPDYPLAIHELAAAHHLQPPWFSLPPSREKWDPYRFRRSMAKE